MVGGEVEIFILDSFKINFVQKFSRPSDVRRTADRRLKSEPFLIKMSLRMIGNANSNFNSTPLDNELDFVYVEKYFTLAR